MKKYRPFLVAVFAAISVTKCFAISGLTIQAINTNIVLSWPSPQGSELYAVQFRGTLDSNDSWITLTSAYRATHAGTTTFTNYGLVPPPSTNVSSGGDPQPVPAPTLQMRSKVPLSDSSDGDTPQSSSLPPMPPMPWDSQSTASTATRPGTLAMQSAAPPLDSDNGPTYGFFRVLQTPNFIGNISTNHFNGPTFLPVDFGDSLSTLSGVDVLLNGVHTDYALLTNGVYKGSNVLGVQMYFDRIPNGTYSIQLVSTIRVNNLVTYGASESISNLPITITIDNQITFANWHDTMRGDSYTFNAQTKNLNTDWKIQIYDYQGLYVNGTNGHTTNGIITWTWDLMDTTQWRRDTIEYDPWLSAVVTFTPTSQSQMLGGPAPTNTSTPKLVADYPQTGGWLVSYLDRFYLEGGPSQQGAAALYANCMSLIVGAPRLKQIPAQQQPINFGTNFSQQTRNMSWTNLLTYLTTPWMRNFYYYGHGATNGIGADIHEYDATGKAIDGIILDGSHAYLSDSMIKQYVTKKQCYRFVFLDCCFSAKGSLPGAFDFPQASYSNIADWTPATNSNRTMPGAFAGWIGIVGGSDWSPDNTKYLNFRPQMFGYWVNNPIPLGLDEAFDLAADSSKAISRANLHASLRIYGLTSLRFDAYNHKGQSPW